MQVNIINGKAFLLTCFEANDKNTFSEILKLEVVIPNLNIFTMRLEDEILKDANKYNGTFEKIAVGVLTNIITCIIKVYRDSKK